MTKRYLNQNDIMQQNIPLDSKWVLEPDVVSTHLMNQTLKLYLGTPESITERVSNSKALIAKANLLVINQRIQFMITT